ncbi:MAG: DUF234 domain-containing protein [Armatimonadetes bacterium]|nr:DUF234 domain-containing protein [Armatimonadota bacterium]
MQTLQDLGLLIREVPITERRNSRSRNSLYLIADHYLDFWYRYVDANRSLVTRGLEDRIWDRAIAPSLHHYVSRPAFERSYRQYLWRALEGGRLPLDLAFSEVGNWWKNGSIEIDAAAVDERGQVTLAGLCKWTESPVDVKEYAHLQRNLDAAQSAFPLADGPWLALFSRSGFTPALQSIAASQKPKRLLLIDPPELYFEASQDQPIPATHR